MAAELAVASSGMMEMLRNGRACDIIGMTDGAVQARTRVAADPITLGRSLTRKVV